MDKKYEGLMKSNEIVRGALKRLKAGVIKRASESVEGLHDMMDFMMVDAALNIFMDGIEKSIAEEGGTDGDEETPKEMSQEDKDAFAELMKSIKWTEGGDLSA